MPLAQPSRVRGGGGHRSPHHDRHHRCWLPGQRALHPLCTLLLLLVVLPAFARYAAAAAPDAATDTHGGGTTMIASDMPSIVETQLIAVDLGHENMKVSAWRVQQQQSSVVPDGDTAHPPAAAAPTAPPAGVVISGAASIVLNDQTNRKSPPCVAFRYFREPASAPSTGGTVDHISGALRGRPHPALHPRGYWLERTFAEQAQALAPRFPTQVVCSPAQLLGYAAAPPSSPTDARAGAPYAGAAEDLEALTASLSYRVMPLTPPTRTTTATTTNNSTAAGRRALGVYVPFFSSTSARPSRRQRGGATENNAAAAAGSTSDAEVGALFSPEEVTAMLLGYARRMAEKADAADNAISEDDQRVLSELLSTTTPQQHQQDNGKRRDRERETSSAASATSTVRYAALTVPVHATIAQRQALMDAAAMAGLRVMRLVHSTTAAAVQLAYTKAEQVLRPDKPQHVMVYDMGSLQTDVAVYRFTAVPTSVASRTRVQASLELLALVGSRTLGGAALDRCLAAAWDARFFNGRVLGTHHNSSNSPAATHKVKEDRDGDDVGVAATLSAKERGSLLRAAQRAKEMLSANQEALITIDGVHADPALFDATGQQQQQQRLVAVTADGLLSLRATRADFEDTCQHVLDEAVALRDAALAATGGVVPNVQALDRLEVIGGGTRVPRLLQRLGEGYGASGVVDRTLNSDEAAVMGATLLAVSGAMRTLPLRGSQTLPRYRVREWLTSTVYAAVSLDGNSSTATAPEGGEHRNRVLFPARSTTLPATRSVRVRLPLTPTPSRDANAGTVVPTTSAVDSVSITLYADAATDAAHVGGPGPARGNELLSHDFTRRDCAGCYVQTCTVTGVQHAIAALMRQRANPKQLQQQQRAQLTAAEVVVEVVATVSGIPRCSVAYVRAEVDVAVGASAAPPPDATADAQPPQQQQEEHEEKPTEQGAPPESPDNTAGDDTDDEEGEAPQPHQQQEAGAEPNVNTNPSTTTTTTTTTPTTSNPGATTASSAAQPQREVRVAPLVLRVSRGIPNAHADRTEDGPTRSAASVGPAGYNVDFSELVASHHRVRALQAMDDVRLRRSTLRNDIESVLVWIKEHHADWNDEVAGDDARPWRATVREVGEWLDDFGDTAGVAALEERLRSIAEVKRVLRQPSS